MKAKHCKDNFNLQYTGFALLHFTDTVSLQIEGKKPPPAK